MVWGLFAGSVWPKLLFKERYILGSMPGLVYLYAFKISSQAYIAWESVRFRFGTSFRTTWFGNPLQDLCRFRSNEICIDQLQYQYLCCKSSKINMGF